MGISSFRSFLQSLCCNTPWCYAVFWKLQYQNEMILAWEDGFCDNMIAREPLGQIDDIFFESSNKILASNLNSTLLNGTPSEYPIGLAVSEMSSAVHVYGNGVVGEAAYTGSPKWIYSDHIASGLSDSYFVVEYPNELLLQFIAGIKTILLLPVLPHGVLQLGSIEMVTEDATVVAYAKQKFESYKRFVGYEAESPIPKLSFMSTHMINFEEPSAITSNRSNGDQKAINSVGTRELNMGAANQMMPFMVQDLCKMMATGIRNAYETQINNGINLQSLGMAHVAELQVSHLIREDVKSDGTENTVLPAYFNDKTKAFHYCDNFSWKYGESMSELGDYHLNEGVIETNFMGSDLDHDFDETGASLFSFPSQYELHKALGPAVLEYSNHIYDSSMSCHIAAWGSNSSDLSHCIDLSGAESALLPHKEDEMETLLEAVADDSFSSTVDNSENQPIIGKTLKTPPGIPLTSFKKPKIKRNASWEEDTTPCSFLTSADQEITAVTSFSPCASSMESLMTALIDKQLQNQRKGCDTLILRKRSRLSSTDKRNSCAVNNQKPRPRDRQLIHNRIKDLRELVPNSDKCSIDGLLDKTIKHMLFLRNVSDQADKLQHQALKDVSGQKTAKTTEVNHGHQIGTSWAIELGKEHQQCPIVVKDLDHPGQMIIEMLCDDHCRFLEIADVIHRLQLTILKAVMEKCSENSWARFIVEATGSFQRLDIFWPLMQLLQHPMPMGRKMI